MMLQSFSKVTRFILVKNQKSYLSILPRELSRVALVNEANLIHLEEKQKLSISFAQEKHDLLKQKQDADLSSKFASEKHDILMKFINDKHSLNLEIIALHSDQNDSQMLSVDNPVGDAPAEVSKSIPKNPKNLAAEAPNHDNVVDADKDNEEDNEFISNVYKKIVDVSITDNATKVVNLIHKYSDLNDGKTLLTLIRGVTETLYDVDKNDPYKAYKNLDRAGLGTAIFSVIKNIQNIKPDNGWVLRYCGEIIKIEHPFNSTLYNKELFDVLYGILTSVPQSAQYNDLRVHLCYVIRALAIHICSNCSKNKMMYMGFATLLLKHKNEHNEEATKLALESLGVKEL